MLFLPGLAPVFAWALAGYEEIVYEGAVGVVGVFCLGRAGGVGGRSV